jgi:hypothetical protein
MGETLDEPPRVVRLVDRPFPARVVVELLAAFLKDVFSWKRDRLEKSKALASAATTVAPRRFCEGKMFVGLRDNGDFEFAGELVSAGVSLFTIDRWRGIGSVPGLARLSKYPR